MKYPSFLLAIALIAMIPSCNRDDDSSVDYNGKWMTNKNIAESTGYTTITYYLEIDNNQFKETFIDPPRTSYNTANQICLEGSVSRSGNVLKLIVHQLSVSSYDRASETFSDPYTVTYTDQDFGFNYDGLTFSVGNYQSEYTLHNDSLILRTDYNRDGIFTEAEVIYIPQ